eukprot:7588410-Pyramimonas_sp.AAC.1
MQLTFADPLDQEILSDGAKLSAFLERHPVEHHPRTKRTYHAVTQGFILNELVRRVDPQQRSIGDIIEQVWKGVADSGVTFV